MKNLIAGLVLQCAVFVLAAKVFASPHMSWREVEPVAVAIKDGKLDWLDSHFHRCKLSPNIDSAVGPLLQWALKYHQPAVAQWLVLRGAKVNIADQKYRSPLHLAAKLGYPELVSVLLESGAEIDARDCQGRTPLHHAIINNHYETAAVLVRNGANPNAVISKSGKFYGAPAIHVAIDEPDRRLFWLLLEHKGNPCAINTITGESALFRVTNNHRAGRLRGVLSQCSGKGFYELANCRGETALFVAARRNLDDIVDLLIGYGAIQLLTRNTVQGDVETMTKITVQKRQLTMRRKHRK